MSTHNIFSWRNKNNIIWITPLSRTMNVIVIVILNSLTDLGTITMRQDVVSELIEKEQIFYNLDAVIGRFLDIDHILSQCVQLPKQNTVKTAENKITYVMYLKHTLELIEPLREALGDCENPLLASSYKV